MTDSSTKLCSTPSIEGPASASDTDTNADESMRLAIARFRSRMLAVSQKFLRDRIDEIESKGLATEAEKRRLLGQYRWIDLDRADDDPETRARRGRTQIPPQTSANKLNIPAILNALPTFVPADGVLPPLLRTEQWRQMCLDTVQRVCQGEADALVDEDEPEVVCHLHQDHRPMTIPQCDELTPFLKYAQGVVDVDFWHSSIAPFTAAWSTGLQDEELDGIDEEQRRDKLADPELLQRK